jgi:hypothetical protein
MLLGIAVQRLGRRAWGFGRRLPAGSFWPTWLLAMVGAGVAGPVSYVTPFGD